jgi:hypothetical protein
MKLVITLLAVMLAALPATAQVLVDTGFEPPEYVSGDITGQQGWITDSTNFTVTALPDFVISGQQSLLVTGNAGRLGRLPISGAGPLMRIEVTMAKAAVNNAQWWVTLQTAAGTGRSAAFGFNNGFIQYYQAGPGWTTYSTFQAATAYRFRADVDITAKVYSLWVNGNLVAENIPTFSTTPAIPEQVYFYRGFLSISGQPAWWNYAVADDLKVTVIPEPASLLTLAAGLSGLAAALRRRS